MDGYESHCTKQFVDICEAYNIHPFAIPPHTSHLLQPLDKVSFRTFKAEHTDAIDKAARTGCKDYNIMEFLHGFKKMRVHAFNLPNIRASWRQAGLYPLNQELILALLRRKLAPESDSEQEKDSEPLPSSPPIPRTPRSRLISRNKVDASLSRYEDIISSPTFHSINKHIWGLERDATERDLFHDTLRGYEAANARRREIITGGENRRRLNTSGQGGLISVEQAREMTKSRHERDAEKARAIIERHEAAEARRKRMNEEEEARGIARWDREETQRQNALEREKIAVEKAEKAEKKRKEREIRDNEAEELRGIRETDMLLAKEAREEAENAKKKVSRNVASQSTVIDDEDIASQSQALHRAKRAVSKAQSNIRKRARMEEDNSGKKVMETIPRTTTKGRIIRPSVRLQD